MNKRINAIAVFLSANIQAVIDKQADASGVPRQALEAQVIGILQKEHRAWLAADIRKRATLLDQSSAQV
jgi:hypothetical protein